MKQAVRILLTALILIGLSKRSLFAAEIEKVSEHKSFIPKYDGVVMDEYTFKDYVFKAREYDELSKENDRLHMIVESGDCQCRIYNMSWFIGGLLTMLVIKEVVR